MTVSLLDKTANHNDLTATGSPVGSADTPFAASTQSVDMEKDNPDYFTAADNASLDITGDLTIEMWVKRESSGIRMEILNKYGSSPNKGYQFTLNADDTVGLRLSDDGSSDNSQSSTGTVATGSWIHIAVSYVASTGVCSFYINGSASGTPTSTKTSIHANNELLYIAAENGGGSPYDGLLDEVRIWNVARTGTEINNNKGVSLPGNEPGLVAYYQYEPGGSASQSPSSSASRSVSPSPSLSPSASQSPSPSASQSPSSSTSASASRSASRSQSPSLSLSPSASLSPSSSTSKSASASASRSESKSLSPSASHSPSSSGSPSLSPSRSLSQSSSVSSSPSPTDNSLCVDQVEICFRTDFDDEYIAQSTAYPANEYITQNTNYPENLYITQSTVFQDGYDICE